jgi:hypothetical protein
MVAGRFNVRNPYTSLHYHVVFSTKRRERWIVPPLVQRIWPYLGGIARENCVNMKLNVMRDMFSINLASLRFLEIQKVNNH